jgi:putative membrane protein
MGFVVWIPDCTRGPIQMLKKERQMGLRAGFDWRNIRLSILKDPAFSLVILALGFVMYFFLGVGFPGLDTVSQAVMPLLVVLGMFYAYAKNIYSFTIFVLSFTSLILSFGISFGKMYSGDSPIAIGFVLGRWQNFILSLIGAAIFFQWHETSKAKEKYPWILLVLFMVIWTILSINVTFFDDWKMENYLTVPFVVILYMTYRKFKMSNFSYLLIYSYMFLHVIGTHYTYSEVPFGFWLEGVLDLPRNHYDRIIHFCFGFLLAYPVREIAIRIGDFKGVWNLYFPIDLVLAFSCLYELIEWGIAVVFGGDLGVAYLGSQGDVWDAQKDMAMAGLGAVIAMFLTFILTWMSNTRQFNQELAWSVKVKQ